MAMDNNFNINDDIKEFLIGVSDHLKNELYSFNYQNTFKDHQEFKSDEESSKKLLKQCEILLNRLSIYNFECKKCSIDRNNMILKENFKISKSIANDSSDYDLDLIKNNKNVFGSYDTVANEGNYEPYLVMNVKHKKQESNSNDYVDFKSSSASFHRLSLNDSYRNVRNCSDFSSLTSTPIKKRNSISSAIKTDDEHNYDLCSNLINSNFRNDGKKLIAQSAIKSTISKLFEEKLELDEKLDKVNSFRHKRSKSFDSNSEVKLINLRALSCPYVGLPLAHLTIYNSIKHGYLVRIEKRFLFDQTKKIYCGIINEWLLCYNSDGISESPIKKIDNLEVSELNSGSNDSNENIEKFKFISKNNAEVKNRLSLCNNQLKPIQCIHLKDLIVEHYRESKKRDIQFQIYSNSGLIENQRPRFIFQAQNEIDCKEWILAIEASKRGDFDQQLNSNEQIHIKQEKSIDSSIKAGQFTINFANNLRRLPTPPQSPEPLCCCNVQYCNSNNCDDIYEDPGAWLKVIEENNMTIDLKPPELPIKTNRKSIKTETDMELNDIVNYDIPKCLKLKSDSQSPKNINTIETEPIYEKYSTSDGKSSLIIQSHIYDSPKKINKKIEENLPNKLSPKKILHSPNASRIHSDFKKAQLQINNISIQNQVSDCNNKLILAKNIEINDQQQNEQLLPNKSSLHEINKSKEEFQMKIKNIHSKLSNQLLNNSPEQRYKKLQQNKKLNKTNYVNEISPNKKSPIPIKNWFLNRIKTNGNELQ